MLDLIKTTRKWKLFKLKRNDFDFIRNIWQKLFIFEYLLKNRRKKGAEKIIHAFGCFISLYH